MIVDLLLNRIKIFSDKQAIVHNNKIFYYKDIINLKDQYLEKIQANSIMPGQVVALKGDYSINTIALVIALIINKNIIVPLTLVSESNHNNYYDISKTGVIIDLLKDDIHIQKKEANPLENELLKKFLEEKSPGLVLFTSGSSGTPKGVLHNFYKLLLKFENANKPFSTLCFLLFDHIAGIDTYFYSLFSGGTLVFPNLRTPKEICSLIEQYKVEVLPTSPTFLNLMLLSEEYKNFDLSSLKIITFGSEPMPGFLLKKLEQLFPDINIIQKYGMTELGSPPSKSNKEDSTWIKFNSDKFLTKIVNNRLYIKAKTAMIGYLNAPSPFTEDGWFDTGDNVKMKDDYIKIIGRESDIINVGGEKVYPSEVEEIIQMMPNVKEVAVCGISNPITGNMVQAVVQIIENENLSEFRKRMRTFCKDKLPKFQIPQKVIITDKEFHGGRFKKNRLNLLTQ